MKPTYKLFAKIIPIALLTLLACQKPTDGIDPGDPGVELPPPTTGTPTEVGQPVGIPTSKTIGQAGGTISTPDGALTLTFPAGAVSKETVITIQPVENKVFTGAGLGYSFGPDGSQFAKPITMTWHYKADDLIGSAPEALGIAFQDKQGVWQSRAKVQVNKTAQTVSAQLTHFSIWAFYEQFYLNVNNAKNETTEVVTLAPGGHASLTVNYYERDLKDTSLLAPLVSPKVMKAERVVRWLINGFTADDTPYADNGQIIEDNQYAQAVYDAPLSEPKNNPVAVSVEIDLKQYGHLILARYIKIESKSYLKVGDYSDSNPSILLTLNTKTGQFTGALTNKTGLKNLTFIIQNFHSKGTYEVDEESTIILAARIDERNPYGPGYYKVNDPHWISGGGKITITEYDAKSHQMAGTVSGTLFRAVPPGEIESISSAGKFQGVATAISY